MLTTVTRRANTRTEANTSSRRLTPREVGARVNVVKVLAGEMLRGNRIWAVDDAGIAQWSGSLKLDFDKIIINEPPIFKLYQIKKVWELSTGENVRICVVDSGIKETKSLLNAVHQFDELVSNSMGKPLHGTYMAEIIAGFDPDNSIFGLCPNAQVISHKIETPSVSPFQLLEILQKYPDVDIFNFSLTGNSEFNNQDSQEMHDLLKYINELTGKNKIMIASTGNDGFRDDTRTYPANFSGFISTAGLTFLNNEQGLWTASNRWRNVSILTPADSYFEINRDEYKDFAAGTSIACAFMTGISALLVSYFKKIGVTQYINRIKSFVDNLPTLPVPLTDGVANLRQLPPTALLTHLKKIEIL